MINSFDFKTTYLAPGIGWRWTSASGFFWGMELGAQIPLSSSAVISHSNTAIANSAAAQTLQTEVNDQANTFGNRALPALALIQFGYFL